MTLTTVWHTLAVVAVFAAVICGIGASYWPDRHPEAGLVVYFGLVLGAAFAIAAWG